MVAICAAVSVVAWSLNSHFAQGQGRERVIEKAFTRNSPVEISEVKVSQKAVEVGKGFDADDDWLDTVFLRIKNSSEKSIVYLEINFNFPETRSTGSMMSYPLSFGLRPGSKFPQKHDPIFMMPGDILEIPLDKHYAKIKSFVERRHRITDIHKLELEIGFVIFADKTCWAAGNFCRQDPNDPDHFINTGDRPEPNQ
jgi:hypothetical protein